MSDAELAQRLRHYVCTFEVPPRLGELLIEAAARLEEHEKGAGNDLPTE